MNVAVEFAWMRATLRRSQRGFMFLVAAGLIASYLAGVGVVLALDARRAPVALEDLHHVLVHAVAEGRGLLPRRLRDGLVGTLLGVSGRPAGLVAAVTAPAVATYSRTLP